MNKLITSLLVAGLVSSVFAQDNPRGEFYIKDDVKGFIGANVGFGQHSEAFIAGINSSAFLNDWGFHYNITTPEGKDSMVWASDDADLFQYNQFGVNSPQMSIILGGQYGNFSTWFDGNFILTNVSQVPAAVKANEPIPFHRDVRWFRLGFDWMFGYELLGGKSPFTLIPAIGIGYSQVAIRYAQNYTIHYPEPPDKIMEYYNLGNRYYSTSGKTVASELEARLRLTKSMSVGAVANMRFMWLDKIIAETSDSRVYLLDNNEIGGFYWNVGVRFVYTMRSKSQEAADKDL